MAVCLFHCMLLRSYNQRLFRILHQLEISYFFFITHYSGPGASATAVLHILILFLSPIKISDISFIMEKLK